MFMEKDVTERLNKFIKAKRLTNRYIADKINMAEATLNNKLNGTRGLDLETLQKILAQFKDLSANWLLRGEGEMLRDNILEDSTNLSKQTFAEDRNSVDIIIKNEIKKNYYGKHPRNHFCRNARHESTNGRAKPNY